MAYLVFFEQSNSNQSDDLMIQNESILENENSLFDCRIFEQSIISEEDPLDLFNLEDEENISFEKENVLSNIMDISSFACSNEKSNDSIKIQEKMIKKKRGKPASNENQKIHTKEKNDNILRKIQTSYFTFIIKFLNEFMKNENLKYKFIDFSHSFKKNIKIEFRKELRNKTIKDIILKFPISPKNSNYNINHNINVYNKLCEQNQYIILNILEKNYLYFFEKIYYNNCIKFNLRQFGLDDYEIELSKNVNTYKDLLKKGNNKELEYKNLIEKCIKLYFLSKEYNINA